MKIIWKEGDALTGPEAFLAHGCNNKGVMGSGIANQIRLRYEDAYDYYRFCHYHGGLKLGDVLPYECRGKVILNCITQDGYGKDGKQYVDYEALMKCMVGIQEYFDSCEIKPVTPKVAMPMIGAGLGGGDWPTIEKIIENNSPQFQPVVYKL